MSDPQKPNGTPVPGPSSPLVQQPQQFAQGFSGMATEAFPDKVRAILAETPKHEDVQIKPDGIVFMPGVWWRRQLTRAFGQGGWALAPRGPTRTVGNAVEYHGALYALGRWVSEAVGGADSGYMSHADLVESARTDCLSKCCKDLGMASELWEKDWREAWQQEYAETYIVQSGKDQGKMRYRLKEKRAPRAADLMRDVPTPSTGNATAASIDPSLASSVQAAMAAGGPGAPSDGRQNLLPVSAPAATAAPQAIPSSAAAPNAGGADNAEAPKVDPLVANARKAVKGQMKRLGFTAPEAKTWLTVKFGVAKVDALDDEQLDNAHALLACLSPDDQEPPEKYLLYLDNLHANGKILSKEPWAKP